MALVGMALAATLLLVAGPALGQSSGNKAAKVHADRGLREYNLEHFAKAISEFEEAYAIDPAPVFLFNIAQAHRKSGASDRALSFYRRYLEADPDAPNRSEVEARIRDLERTIAKSNEKEAPSPPPTTAASPGAPAAQAVAPPGPPEKQTEPILVTVPPPPNPRMSRQLRLAAWVTGGAAVAAAGTSVFFLLSANQKAKDFSDHCGLQNGAPIPDSKSAGTNCVSLRDDWDSAKTRTYVTYAVTGALAVSSAVLLLLSRSPSKAPPAETAFVNCSVGAGAFSCRGVF